MSTINRVNRVKYLSHCPTAHELIYQSSHYIVGLFYYSSLHFENLPLSFIMLPKEARDWIISWAEHTLPFDDAGNALDLATPPSSASSSFTSSDRGGQPGESPVKRQRLLAPNDIWRDYDPSDARPQPHESLPHSPPVSVLSYDPTIPAIPPHLALAARPVAEPAATPRKRPLSPENVYGEQTPRPAASNRLDREKSESPFNSNASSEATTANSSKPPRSQSPVKKLLVMGDNGDIIEVNPLEEHMPEILHEINKKLNNIHQAKGFMPLRLKTAWKKFQQSHRRIESLDDNAYYKDSSDTEELTWPKTRATPAQVIDMAYKIAIASNKARVLRFHKVSWNNCVHTPILAMDVEHMNDHPTDNIINFHPW